MNDEKGVFLGERKYQFHIELRSKHCRTEHALIGHYEQNKLLHFPQCFHKSSNTEVSKGIYGVQG
jgi:hypothetical protein